MTGLPTDSVLMEDNAQMVLTDADGKKPLRRGWRRNPIEIRREGSQSGPSNYRPLAVLVPAEVYQDNKDRMVQVDTTYSMTLFKLRSPIRCRRWVATRLISGLVVASRKSMSRRTAFVDGEVHADGQGADMRNGLYGRPARWQPQPSHHRLAGPDYSPYLDRPIPDSVSHFRLVLPFRDPEGQMKYLVDGSKMDAAQIAIRVYEPADHFTRTVTSPLVMMKDLAVH